MTVFLQKFRREKEWEIILYPSMIMFTHCLRRHEKSTCEKLVSA